MISTWGKYLAARVANIIMSTAPMAKFGAITAPTRRSSLKRASSSISSSVRPVVPTTGRTPISRAISTWRLTTAGTVKSTSTSGRASRSAVSRESEKVTPKGPRPVTSPTSSPPCDREMPRTHSNASSRTNVLSTSRTIRPLAPAQATPLPSPTSFPACEREMHRTNSKAASRTSILTTSRPIRPLAPATSTRIGFTACAFRQPAPTRSPPFRLLFVHPGPAVGVPGIVFVHHPIEGFFEVDAHGIGETDHDEQDVRQLQCDISLGLPGLFRFFPVTVIHFAGQLAHFLGHPRQHGEGPEIPLAALADVRIHFPLQPTQGFPVHLLYPSDFSFMVTQLSSENKPFRIASASGGMYNKAGLKSETAGHAGRFFHWNARRRLR